MHGVPLRNPLFTGREDELGLVRKALARGFAALTSGVAALHGMGGEGKTTVAVEYAHRHADEYDRVFMVRAEHKGEYEEKMAALAGELGLPEASNPDQNAQYAAVQGWFASHGRWLLIVDNAEDLPTLKAKLPLDAQSHVLVTTRETVTPRFAPSVEICHLSDEAGSLLLLRCAGLVCAEGEGEPTEGENLVNGFIVNVTAFSDGQRVSAVLGGLALALDHAGTYMARRALNPAAYLELFEKYHTKLFEKGENPDHATVTVTFTMALEQVEAIPEFGPVAVQLIILCAFLAPDVVPDQVFRGKDLDIGSPLIEFLNDDFNWSEVVEAATRFALIRRLVDPLCFSLHRLVAAVIRDIFPTERRLPPYPLLVRLLRINFANIEFRKWTLYAALIPHVKEVSGWACPGENHIIDYAELLNRAAISLHHVARYKEAEEFFSRSLDGLRGSNGSHAARIASISQNFARMLIDIARSSEAKTLIMTALEIDEALPDRDPSNLMRYLATLGGICLSERRFGDAERHWTRALDLALKNLEPNDPEVAHRLSDVATILSTTRRASEAVPLRLRALAILASHERVYSPDYAKILSQLGSDYVREKWYGSAQEVLAEVCRIYDELKPTPHPDSGFAHFYLARLTGEQGDPEGALIHLRKSLDIERRHLPDEHPTIQAILNAILTEERASQLKQH